MPPTGIMKTSSKTHPPARSSSKNKKNARSRRRERETHITAALSRDNAHLNTTLRSLADDNQRLRSLADENKRLITAYRTVSEANSALDLTVQQISTELAHVRRDRNQYIQDLHLNSLMERDDLNKQIANERTRLLRKLAAERNRAEVEEKRLSDRIQLLERDVVDVTRKSVEYMHEKTDLQEMLAKEGHLRERAVISLDICNVDLECAKAEAVRVRDDMAELQRLDMEEHEREKMGLPPAYGGLDEIDTPPWARHCTDVGRLDGGCCGVGMSLLESVTEESFGKDLREAQATAGKLRHSRDPSLQQAAGISFFNQASSGLARACASLVKGMDQVIHLETTLAKPTPPTTSRVLSSPTNTTFKRRRISTKKGSGSAEYIKIEDIDEPMVPTPSFFSIDKPSPNYTLAHRCTTKILSLIWQTLSAFHLRPFEMTFTTTMLRLQVSAHWGTIEDSLQKAITAASSLPLAALEEGKCSGCSAPNCGGRCVRLCRLQSYATQLTSLSRGLQTLIPGSAAYLAEIRDNVEDIVATERRCAASFGEGGRTLPRLVVPPQQQENPIEEMRRERLQRGLEETEREQWMLESMARTTLPATTTGTSNGPSVDPDMDSPTEEEEEEVYISGARQSVDPDMDSPTQSLYAVDLRTGETVLGQVLGTNGDGYHTAATSANPSPTTPGPSPTNSEYVHDARTGERVLVGDGTTQTQYPGSARSPPHRQYPASAGFPFSLTGLANSNVSFDDDDDDDGKDEDEDEDEDEDDFMPAVESPEPSPIAFPSNRQSGRVRFIDAAGNILESPRSPGTIMESPRSPVESPRSPRGPMFVTSYPSATATRYLETLTSPTGLSPLRQPHQGQFAPRDAGAGAGAARVLESPRSPVEAPRSPSVEEGSVYEPSGSGGRVFGEGSLYGRVSRMGDPRPRARREGLRPRAGR
jgi:hypothetical protein